MSGFEKYWLIFGAYWLFGYCYYWLMGKFSYPKSTNDWFMWSRSSAHDLKKYSPKWIGFFFNPLTSAISLAYDILTIPAKIHIPWPIHQR